MLLFYPTANLQNLKKEGGLAVVGKIPATTGFGELQTPIFHRVGAVSSPKKNEVSGLVCWNPYSDWAEGWGV